LIHNEKIGESDICVIRYPSNICRYIYVTVDRSTKSKGDVRPAYKMNADVFIADVNSNKFPDIILRKKYYTSKAFMEGAINESPFNNFLHVNDEFILIKYIPFEDTYDKITITSNAFSKTRLQRTLLFKPKTFLFE